MQLVSIIPGFQAKNDERLLAKAEELRPELMLTHYPAPKACRINHKSVSPEDLADTALSRGDQLLLDFGRHLVGRLTLELEQKGSYQDAPAFIQLDFAEIFSELEEDPDEYNGWLSRSWIQQERLHVDVLPAKLTLPRRYAFRYVRLTVLDTSPKYQLSVLSVSCTAESSVDEKKVPARTIPDEELKNIYQTSLRTLAECSQYVLEDGPKRDRRLWLGDLRLQALTAYISFRNTDLIKRCLYMFAGSRFPDGRMSADIFTDKTPTADDTYLMDYALMAVPALEEYMAETNDTEALKDLIEPTLFQINHVLENCLTDDMTISEEAAQTGFIDWSDGLNRRASLQGVLICALDSAAMLCRRINDDPRAHFYSETAALLRQAALKNFWSEDAGCFLSDDQISIHSQVWLALADVVPADLAAMAMDNTLSRPDCLHMATPYMHHYYVMALLKTGRKDRAEAHLRDYWGKMLHTGTDTFWESWDPSDPYGSPYGGRIVNSYCHAWSCTPAYIIDRFLLHDHE